MRARSCSSATHVSALYVSLNAAGLQYGPAYRTLVRAWGGDGDAQARLRARLHSEGTVVHPADLDDALCVGALIGRSSGGGGDGQTRLPYAVDDALLQSSPSGELWVVRRTSPPAPARSYISPCPHSTVI